MITHGRATSWLEDLFDGVHQPGDDYRVALYTDAAEIGPYSVAYTTDGEVVGVGYEAGGQALAGRARGRDADGVFLTFDDPIWRNSTIRADGAMLYNATRDYRALAVVRFRNAPVQSTNGRFRIRWPEAGLTALLRLT